MNWGSRFGRALPDNLQEDISKLIIVKLARWTHLYLLIFLIIITVSSDGLPLVNDEDHSKLVTRHGRQKREDFGDNELQYLMKYGYLPMSGLETGNLRTEKQIRNALKMLQRFGNIPQTGRVDAATRALMKQPRCSLPDVMPDDFPVNPEGQNELLSHRRKRFVKQGRMWDKLNLTWGMNSYPNRLRDLTNDPSHMSKWDIRQQIQLAMELWSKASKLTFTELEYNPSKSDIIIEFKTGYHGDGYPFDGSGRTVAHAFYPGENVGGDMHFDDEENWLRHENSINNYRGVSLLVAAAHELGHSLGLYHSDVQGALMSPYLLAFPVEFELPRDDALGIQGIYGAPDHWRPNSEEIPTWEEDSTSTPKPSPHIPESHPDRPNGGSTEKPNTCDTDYDAISVIRREIHIFKGKYFWRVDERGRLRPGYPEEILRFWSVLPRNLTSVDAVYERPTNGKIVFFIGPRYYVLEGNDQLIQTGPLRHFGLPIDLPKLDAAFVWGHNGRTYFFYDTMYWRFEEGKDHVELDYPRDMLMWRGVPYNIDSAFKFNGTTYFFKGRRFYEFDDLRMKVTRRSPLLSAPFWLNCPNSLENPYYANAQTKQVTSRGHVIGGRPSPGQLLVAMTTLFFQSLFLVAPVSGRFRKV